MPSAQERIQEAVSAIQTWLARTPNPGEAVVRQAIVLRLLHAAGFDIWNPAEIVPEETNATGNRSDFLIRVGKGKFALELKGMNVTLGPAQFQQAATYAVNEETRWAIVTNGRVWIVIDEHLPGKWEDRVALKLELGQEGHTFSDDLATLLDVETWRADAFTNAVQAIKGRQQQRLDEARIRREKTAIVQAVMEQFGIRTFELAAAAAAEMNRITEAERDVLLGKVPPDPHPGRIPFTYKVLGAVAHVVYDSKATTWTVKAGSTALNRVLGEGSSNAQGIKKRRLEMIATGRLIEKTEKYLEYLADMEYGSPSMAAVDIAGSSQNGWDVWKDDQGRPAQHYRPSTIESD
ncbi:DUF4357 domain-containing protein [Deinococcus apachensis]|uniref:DUF4357 domain-containing protein n=1 Tax=Deinococcus apachensis TaxID=309886 RepID=UPI000A05C00C|nr:DUF4357 domain-containing protein [Deinococcus apachensis]